MPDAAALPYDPWLAWQALSETLAAGLDPLGHGQRLRDRRLADLLQAAVAGSPFYRRRVGRRHAADPALADFRPVTKHELMQHFDEWATDRQITRASVEAFLRDPKHLAAAYLGRYLVWTSSGTTGEPGIFVQDAPALAAYDAIDALRLRTDRPGLASGPAWTLAQRFAFVGATGGHFAGNASIARLQRLVPPVVRPFAPPLQVFSVLLPLRKLATELQAYAPTVLITYPSCAAALALEQAAGRLHLTLAETWLGGEQLSDEQRRLIVGAFGATLRNNYGASEFFSIAWECAEGHLHLNNDWVVLEPVDEKLRPVPPDRQADSVLLTNLANRTQPLVRYCLGDRVRQVSAACACGSGFPRIDVEGRADDTLVLDDAEGRPVTLLPLALCTAVEEGAGVAQFQVLRRTSTRLELRLEATQPEPEAASAAARAALSKFLRVHGLRNVRVAASSDEPVRQARTGKLLRVTSA
jgi:phenylacetate-CoA ligase